MDREVRRVPADWQHPRDGTGPNVLVPLHNGYATELADFAKRIEDHGLAEAIDWFDGGPVSENYMPDWPGAERTHWQMYETTSEGTPISPVMATKEELARWLAYNNVSAFARDTATYEQWLSMIDVGWAPSAIATVRADGTGELTSGVVGLAEKEG